MRNKNSESRQVKEPEKKSNTREQYQQPNWTWT